MRDCSLKVFIDVMTKVFFEAFSKIRVISWPNSNFASIALTIC